MIPAWSARERTFIRSTSQAMNGEQVWVASPRKQASISAFERYVKWVGASATVKSISMTGRVVTFHGGGSVRFVTLSGDMRGRRPESVLLDDMEEHE